MLDIFAWLAGGFLLGILYEMLTRPSRLEIERDLRVRIQGERLEEHKALIRSARDLEQQRQIVALLEEHVSLCNGRFKAITKELGAMKLALSPKHARHSK